MKRQRSLGLIAVTVLAALGAGQYMQSGVAESSVAMSPLPPSASVTPVALAPEPAVQQSARVTPAAGTPLASFDVVTLPVAFETTPEPAPIPTPAPEPLAAAACPVTLDVFAETGGMIGVTLTAPCHPNERVVLRHDALAVALRTTATGSLFATIPALTQTGDIALRFADGTEHAGAAPIPELADMRRIAVQWMADDRFALNAFEGGADYGQPGHITAGAGPLHVALGDPSVDLPMLAEVYTLPAKANPRLTIEAAVTATTCGRELIGETLFSDGGKVTVAELTMAVPDCDELGGFVVLNNPLSDMKLALAE
jgi:hypothetical protein